MVVDVAYISKERSDNAGNAPGSVTGILAVQGAFAEHAAMLDRLSSPWRLLRAADDFDESIGRVILPGGESTTQGKLLRSTGLFEPIAAHIAAGKPVFGTCAGMILLARRLENDDNVYFGALDATVRRNAYGRQLGSFAAEETVRTFDAQGEPSSEIADGGCTQLRTTPTLLCHMTTYAAPHRRFSSWRHGVRRAPRRHRAPIQAH